MRIYSASLYNLILSLITVHKFTKAKEYTLLSERDIAFIAAMKTSENPYNISQIFFFFLLP